MYDKVELHTMKKELSKDLRCYLGWFSFWMYGLIDMLMKIKPVLESNTYAMSDVIRIVALIICVMGVAFYIDKLLICRRLHCRLKKMIED